jgi:hypothetical protein
VAKRIIILEQLDHRQYRYVLWAPVPTERQPFYAAKAIPTAYVNATAGEKTAVLNGSIAERVGVIESSTVAEARQQLVDAWTSWANYVADQNTWVRYGTFWDETGWTAGGVD